MPHYLFSLNPIQYFAILSIIIFIVYLPFMYHKWDWNSSDFFLHLNKIFTDYFCFDRILRTFGSFFLENLPPIYRNFSINIFLNGLTLLFPWKVRSYLPVSASSDAHNNCLIILRGRKISDKDITYKTMVEPWQWLTWHLRLSHHFFVVASSRRENTLISTPPTLVFDG